MKIAAVIPAYQAAATVADVVRRSHAVIDSVWVVDDGSTDGTGERARGAGARLLVHPVNRGKGWALVTAFSAVFAEPFDGVITLDADGQHLPEEMPRLLRAAATGADIVLGTREALWGEMGRVRRTSNRLSSWAISVAAGARFTDIQTGFRYYSRRLHEQIGFPPGRFESESAVVVRAARSGLTVKAVPVRLGFADGRCTSHYRPFADSMRIAAAVIRARVTPSIIG